MANLRGLRANVPGIAVDVAVTLFADITAAAGVVRAAAVHVGLVTVQAMVRAGVRDASARNRIARK